MNNFFYKTYKIISSKKLISFLGFLILVSGLIFLTTKIEFEEDITKLIPTNSQNSDAQKVLKTVNFADKIIVNIIRDSSGSIDDLTQYASQFIDSLNKQSSNYFTKIQGRIEDDAIVNTLAFVYENLPVFLEDADYITIKNKLEKDSIDAITQANYKTLVSPSGFVAKEIILKDPLGLSFIALKKLQQLSFGDDFNLKNGFLLSKDQNHILLFITPTHESSETSENALFAEQLYTLRDQLNKEFKNKTQSEYFGGALVAVANAKQIKHDIQITVGIAMSILLIILIVFYRKISTPLILLIPTAFGALLAIALLFLIRGKISAISLGIGSILLGVTLDYALHILTHLRSNNNIKALYQDITKPILMSSLTTALAFLCLLFLNSQVLQDLGIFAAISVIGASCFSLVFIPLVYKNQQKVIKQNTIIDKIASYPFHKNKWALIILALLFTVSFFTYSKVSFNNDLAKLNFEPQELMDARKRLDALTNIESKSIYLAAYGNNEQEAIQTNDSILTTLNALKKANKIIDFSSIGVLIQSEKLQKQRLKKWESFWTQETIQNTQNNLIESGEKLGFKPTSFQAFYQLLNSKFTPLSVSNFEALNTFSVDDYITTKNNFTTVTSLVKVKNEQVGNLINTFKNNPKTLVIDRKLMNETFLGNLKNDFNRLVLYSFIIVLVLLLLFYRSVSLTLVTSIPIALTWLLTIGVMGLTGIEFNIFNIIISTFIFGLGIDYSIFITNGLLHELKTGERVLATHKTSIILSVITTILGVGVLIFAKHPALHSISLVSIIGILSALIIAFTIQPILFKLFIGSKHNRPSPIILLIHSIISFIYYGLGSLFISILGVVVMKIVPISKKKKMAWFHKLISKFMKSVLGSNPHFKTKIINTSKESFSKQAVIIANHTSFLDILAISMLHPKLIFLVNDWVYNSPFFGKAAKLVGFYPISNGIENGLSHLQKKVDQGYSLIVFPEGTRSYTNKIKRFHKGAFYLAEKFNLDILPIIIHGSSKILPKGNLSIKRGVLTIKILDRISSKDTSFGVTDRERKKLISANFKKQFKDFRNDFEEATYFHKVVLEDYRYKGDALFKKVKQDLNENQDVYKYVLDSIGEKDTIIHLSKDCGQLDFLLALDSPSRKITSFIEDESIRAIAKNSFISNNHYKISHTNTVEDVLKTEASVLIINLDNVLQSQIETILPNGVSTLILLFESQNSYSDIINKFNFKVQYQATNICILTKQNAI